MALAVSTFFIALYALLGLFVWRCTRRRAYRADPSLMATIAASVIDDIVRCDIKQPDISNLDIRTPDSRHFDIRA